MENFIIIFSLVAIASLIIAYLLRQKKRGVRCIGCPYARECAKRHCESLGSTKKRNTPDTSPQK